MVHPQERSLQLVAPRVAPRIHAVPAPKPSIIRFVDAVDVPVALTNRDGQLTTMNSPARDFFIGRTGAQLREVLENTVRVAMTDRRRPAEFSPNPTHRFEINQERFVATFVLAANDLATQDIGAMIMLRRESLQNGPSTEESLASRFGLTRQEARVALMLADQRSNRDIADRLGISVHTARHHTERVLSKLEIHSRYDVKRVLG